MRLKAEKSIQQVPDQHPVENMIPYPFLRSLIVTAMFAGLTGGALSAAPEIPQRSPRDDAEIRAVLSAQVAAWNRGDIDGFMSGYARSAATEFIAGDQLTRGWQTVRDRYKKKYNRRDKMGRLVFSELKVTRLSGGAALAIGRWTLTRKNDQPHGRFTLLFRRTPDGWRITHDHTSAAEG
jgi:ketosteroid isomerase-like protein